MYATLLSLPSPIEQISVDGRSFYLKRDDLTHPDFSGNKARKFYYYLSHDFPQVKKIVSHGSNQSNAMYSLSVLAKLKGWEFEYFVNHIPDYLRENPQGNYRKALENGMRISEQKSRHPELDPGSKHDDQFYQWILNQVQDDKRILFIEEGGRQKEAEVGIRILADEIINWQKEQGIEKLNIFLPSGTGTTALFLQKSFSTLNDQRSLETKVFTTPCVGDASYLKKQFFMLEGNEAYHPTILDTEKKYHFGKLYKDFYKIWLKLRQQTGVEFDLLYDPKGWMTVMAYPEIFSQPTLYIHQGGLAGNESMLPRYERKYKDVM
ncbi:MAG: 1-aminocyclopropane-1-carboxylate deaminase/D-cysteine desulfhydrase [Campylobacterota bacterium]|nr:1-aminocyclopropane-1-carboxylate deaminase/D-cysteine desulfhydrase [Campylobacterota bacterium]